MATTRENITSEQCDSLRREAQVAGDVTMADMAAAAVWDVEHDERSTPNVLACVAAIRNAECAA